MSAKKNPERVKTETITFSVPKGRKAEIKKAAAAENRSLSNYIETRILNLVKKDESSHPSPRD